MSLFEKISVITERKYLPNDPSSKKSPIKRVFGKIFSNKAKDIRQAPGDPLMGPPGLDYNDPNDLPSNKLGKPTYKNIPKGSLPKPKTPVQLPPAKTSKTVKQSDVSKKQKEFRLKVDDARREKLTQRIKARVEKRKALKTGSKGRRAERQNPTTKKTVSQVKADIEFKKNLKKAGGSGDIGYTAPDRISKIGKRTTRAVKQGTPDPFKVDTSKAAKQSAKTFGTPTKSQIKKLDKKPGGYRAPKGIFGIGDTKGQMTVKSMDAKAFKITTPKDIIKDPKLSKQYGVKSFQKFSRDLQAVKDSKKNLYKFDRDLQDFKDRDMPGGPRKTKTTKPKFSDVDDLTRQDVGMAPKDTPKRTPRVKQILDKAKTQKAVEMGGKEYNRRNREIFNTIRKKRNVLAKKPNRTSKTVKQIRSYNKQLKGKQIPDEVALATIPKKSNTPPPPLDPPPNNSSRKTFKQMQRDIRGRDGKVTFNMTEPPAAKLTRGFKGELGKRAFVGKVAKGLAKRPGLTGALTIAGLYGANELRKAFFGPKAPKREKIKITPPKDMDPKSKTYGQRFKKFSDIPQNQLTKTDKELMNVGRSSISPAALKQMGKGGRYDPGKGFNLKKYSQSDAYKDTLRQIRVKTGKKNLDPYKVFGNKK